MKTLSVVVGILLCGSVARAGILEVKGADASLAIAAAPALPKLRLTGEGVRKKKIVLVKVDVYRAASYLDAAVKMDPQKPMESIRRAKAKALHLTFLRDLGAAKIRSSFRDALKRNQVDPESPVMRKALATLDFDVKEGQTLSLVGYKKDEKTDVLVFETPKGPVSLEGPDAASQFWLIWFGEPEDSGLENLKKDLVGFGEG